LIEALTSNGYIVAAPDHTYDCNLTVFPDGHTADYRSEITGHPDSVRIRRQQLNTRVADVRFILNQMRANEEINKIIDFEKVGVLGHSYGGATAIQTAYEDDHFKAALCLDGWMNPVPDHIYEKGIQQPFLYLGRPRWNNSDYPTSPLKLVQFLQNVKSEKFNYILKGSRHLDFSDLPLFSPLSEFFLDTGTISSKKAVSITNEVVLLFFDRYLKNIMNHFPKSVANYSEIIINPAS
jgi:predicted dienelactone hydrolase